MVTSFLLGAAVATTQLDNGLTLVVAPHRAPVVAVQAWVGVGSADETPAQAGIAHAVEHMLFKGTARRGVGDITSTIEAAGGDVNAWTSFDHTVYHVVLPRADLDVGLDVLADALIGSTFDEDEVERERGVILDELRHGFDDPGRTAAHAVFGAAFVAHPYRRPVIGTAKTVRALRRDDLVAFHRDAYVGRNLTVVVAGDVDPADARARVDRHFGAMRPGTPRRPRPAEPAQRAPRAVVAHHDAVEAHLAIGFHAPPLASPDTPLLDLAAVALGQGESSRLARLRRDGAVTGVAAHLHALRDPGLFVISATARPREAEAAAAAIAGTLGAAARDLDDAEIAKAKHAVLAEQVWQRETVEGLARKYGWYRAAAGDVAFERAYLEGVERATGRAVRDVLARIAAADGATVAAVVPPRRKLAAPRLLDHYARGAKAGAPKRKPRVAGAEPKTSVVTPGPDDVVREVLPNGARVLILRDPSVKVVAMRAVWPGGTRLEDDKTSGTTSLLASVITRGCGDRDGDEVADLVDRLAGGIAGVGGRNSFGLRAEWLADRWEEGLALFADCVTAPRFDGDEVERQRKLLLDDLAARADSGGQQALRLFAETLYVDHPYRLDVLGDADVVEGLTAKKLQRFYRDHFPVSAMTLAIVGDVDPDAVLAELRARFGDEPERDVKARAVPTAKFDGRSEREREVYRDLPRAQAHVVIGFPGTTVTSEDRFAVEVLTSVLGGQSGRLFAELRDRKGLAYRVSAFSVDGIDPGYLAIYVSCAPGDVDAAVAAVKDEIDRVLADGVTDQEVTRTVKHLSGAHAVAMQRRSAIANALAFHEAYGLGWQAWASYPDELAKVDAAAVEAAAKRYLRWDLAVTATVRPPAMSPAAAKRAKGSVHKKPKKLTKKRRKR